MPHWLKAGLITGLCGGVFDGIAASTVYPLYLGMSPVRIWQSVASGVWGRAAYDGGMAMAAYGLLFHFLIAIAAGTALVFAISRVKVLRRWPYPTGAIFGIAQYYFMQLVVLPLSNVTMGKPRLDLSLIGIAIHICIFGIPMALIARRLLRGQQGGAAVAYA